MRAITHLTSFVLLAFALAACATEQTDVPETPETPEMPVEPASVSLPDTTGDAVYAFMNDAQYQNNWSLWPDKGEFYPGTEPHGMLLTTYLNPVAMEALEGDATAMPPGSIVVKENYMPDSMLAAVTVMVKQEPGYNPEHNDWFFTKILADGSVEAMEGMRAEGRVMMCQNCHIGQASNDYLFTGELHPAIADAGS